MGAQVWKGMGKNMFSKFGEFDSYEEINRAAAAQKKEGDLEAVMALAEENGIDKEDAEDYLDGVADSLVNPLMAALGKLVVEEAEMKPYEIMQDWISYIKIRCMESQEVALAVRRKGKSLKGCVGALLKWSFKHAKPVDPEITKAAGIPANMQNRVTLGIPGMGQAKKLITEYYMGDEEK